MFEHYEQHKRDHLKADGLCEEAGISFVPMILEVHGGSWCPSVCRVLDRVSGQFAGVSGGGRAEVAQRLAQRMLCILHEKKNAHALLECAAVATSRAASSGWVADVDAWQ